MCMYLGIYTHTAMLYSLYSRYREVKRIFDRVLTSLRHCIIARALAMGVLPRGRNKNFDHCRIFPLDNMTMTIDWWQKC
jgi:hypothetical protein